MVSRAYVSLICAALLFLQFNGVVTDYLWGYLRQAACHGAVSLTVGDSCDGAQLVALVTFFCLRVSVAVWARLAVSMLYHVVRVGWPTHEHCTKFFSRKKVARELPRQTALSSLFPNVDHVLLA